MSATIAATVTYESVLELWFGDRSDDDATIKQRQAELWWGKDAALDALVAERFCHLLEPSAGALLASWTTHPEGRLAAIIALDQFPRNVFRGTARAFAYDAQALSLCLDGMARGADMTLRLIERIFFYLPLEHSESMPMQDRSVKAFLDLRDEAPAEQRDIFESTLDFARRHRDIIAQFGRYPHRNALLGRMSTPEENAFLQQPHSSF